MTNCPNCGAPTVGGRCEYCGTLSHEVEERIQEIRRRKEEGVWMTISEFQSHLPFRYIPQDTQKKE